MDPNADVARKDDGPPFATGLTGNRGRDYMRFAVRTINIAIPPPGYNEAKPLSINRLSGAPGVLAALRSEARDAFYR